MDAESAFISAVCFERKKVWKKAATSYEEVLRLISRTKSKEHINKEKLRLLFFECHFHCAVAYQNIQTYQDALRHFRRALKVVSWRKDDCEAGCITGRVLHLHVPTLARMACCHIHTGKLNEALRNIENAILLDFNNPDLFCVRALINFFLDQQDKALQDASFSIKLNSSQVCGWLLRGLFKKIKKEASGKMSCKQEVDLDKACEINPDAIMFVSIKDIRNHFQVILDRFLPSIRVSHSLSTTGVIDVPDVSATVSRERPRTSSRLKTKYSVHAGMNMMPTTRQASCPAKLNFVCGVAKLPPRTLPLYESKYRLHCFKWASSEPSISHYKLFNKSRSDFDGTCLAPPAVRSNSTCASRGGHLTLRDVLNTRRACACPSERFIGVQVYSGLEDEQVWSEHNSMNGERMYSRKWMQDRIPTKIPDYIGCRKLS